LKEGTEKALKASKRAFVNVCGKGSWFVPVAETVGVVLRITADLVMSVAGFEKEDARHTMVTKVKAKSMKISMIFPEALQCVSVRCKDDWQVGPTARTLIHRKPSQRID
jgi:hypothetical protein